MRTLSLFSGAGGLDLGLERAGFEMVAACEADEFCRAILSERWPGIPVCSDVREVGTPAFPVPDNIECIAGGFPCQDISSAGKGAGIEGERSGLWFEMLRLVRSIRPRWVIAENVPALRTRGADVVLGGLETEGYACWPLVVGAVHAGAPHRRQRVFIVARLADAGRDDLRVEQGRFGGQYRWEVSPEPRDSRDKAGLADADDRRGGQNRQPAELRTESLGQPPCDCGTADEAASQEGRWHGWPARPGEKQQPWEAPRTTEPGLGRATNGLPGRLDARERKARLRALGNAVVPQVAEAVGKAIQALESGP